MAAKNKAQHTIEQGKKLLKEGKKLAKGGIFSKSNPDEAEKKYEAARKKFRFLKPATAESVSLYLESLKCLSSIREEMNLMNSAATAMEEGARACSNAFDNKLGDTFQDQIPIFLEKAGYYYRLSGQYDLASNNLIKAARSHQNIQEALKLLNIACEIHEDENRYITCHPHFDAAVKFCCENKRYKSADEFLDRQLKMYAKDMDKFGKRIWRNVCSKMIIQFHLKQVKVAQSIYLQAMNEYSDCSNQDEQQICDKLLNVFCTADSDGLIYIQKNEQLGIFFINSIVRIATKLDMVDIKPIVVIKDPNDPPNNNNNNDNDQKGPDLDDDIQQQIKDDIKDDQLKSDLADVQLDDDGAPNLMDM